MIEAVNKPLLRLLIIITDWEKASKINEVFKNTPAHFCYFTKAEGTASSEILDMFGLGRTDKVLILCVAPQPLAQALMMKAADTLLINKKGTGIAFTVLLSGAATNIIRMLNAEAQEMLIDHINKIESEVEKMKKETPMALIMSVINQGYSEDLMEAAKSAGATGGTLIHSRRMGFDERLNFLGLPISEEKEIILILTDRDNKVEIMRAINQKCGLESKAHGVTIALPVDSVVGV